MSCTALLDFNFLISSWTIFLSFGEKWKLEKRWETLLMTRMLGWSLGVSISYEGDSDQQIFLNFQAFYCVRKKVFRVFVTSISSDINFSFFSKVIFFLYLFFSERNGFTVCQNFLLSETFFSFKFAKYFFFSEKRYTKASLPRKG